MLKRIMPLALSALVLTGCSDYDSLQEGVVSHNKRVETSLSSYEKTMPVAKEIEDTILKGFEEGSLVVNETEVIKPEIAKDIETRALELYEYLDNYITFNNALAEAEEETEGDGIVAKVKVFEKINDKRQFIEDIVTINYFIDDKTAKVEQMFLAELPNGDIVTFSFYWVGGLYVESKAINN